MFPRKKKISASLCLSWVTTSAPVWCEPMRVWMTVARSKYFRLPCSCLPDGPRHLEGRRLEALRQHHAEVAREGGQDVHQVEEDGLVHGEQLGVLGGAHGGAAGRAGEQRQLPDHLAGAQVGDHDRLRPVGGGGHHLEHAALDDEEAVPLVALPEDDVPGPELLELALGEHRPDDLRRLVLEELRVAEKGGIDRLVHEDESIIAPRAGARPGPKPVLALDKLGAGHRRPSGPPWLNR